MVIGNKSDHPYGVFIFTSIVINFYSASIPDLSVEVDPDRINVAYAVYNLKSILIAHAKKRSGKGVSCTAVSAKNRNRCKVFRGHICLWVYNVVIFFAMLKIFYS